MAETRQPEEIRSDIEDTREQLGETVEALAAKADVKGQAKAKVDDVKAQAKAKVDGVKDSVAGASPESAKQAASSAAGTVQERPLPFAVIGAFAAGIAIGLFIASRR